MKRLTGRNEHGGVISLIEGVHMDVERTRLLQRLNEYENLMTIEKARELAKARDEKRLTIFPSDAHFLYAICAINCESQDCPRMDDYGGCDGECPDVVLEVDLFKCPAIYVRGSTLYPTREAAESALAEQGVTSGL